MRLRALALASFGPFRDKVLRFERGGIEVVFGPNEAGKSTTRRAVLGLLYGIPERSKDGHTHGDMSIGGTLEDDAGKTIDVVRTKGRKTTLRTPKNEPLDEQVMTKLLGGMDLATYELACGLDHELLRKGGAALRVGNGELGETLFAAATGLSGLHRMKMQLAEEADSLLGRGASKRPLNEATKAFAEAKKRAADLVTSADKWHEQQEQIAKARADLDALRREHAEKTEERARARAIAKAARELESSRARLREVEAALGLTRVELGAIAAAPAELFANAEAIAKLQERLGSHRKAQLDRPQIAADLEAADERVRRAQKEAPTGASAHLPAAAHVRKLAEDGTTLRERARGHEARAAEVAASLERLTSRLASTAAAHDPVELREALEAARREGDIEARMREAQRAADREVAAAVARIAALGVAPEPTLESVATLPVPLRDGIAEHARTVARIADERRTSSARRRELEDERAEVVRAIAALRAEGDLPTDEELAQARADREALWRDVREGKPKPLVVASYERAVRGADDVADRLRREAARVTRLRELEAAREAIARKLEAVASRERELAEETDSRDRSWRALWTGVAVEPREPEQMLAWLARWEAATGAAPQAIEARARAATLGVALATAQSTLAFALAKEGEGEEGASLARLEQLAKRAIGACERAAAERAKLEAEREAAERDRDRAARDRAVFERDFAEWRAQWATCTRALGLPEGASPEQVTAALEAIAQLGRALDEAEKLRRRLAGIDRDALQFAADVRAVCDACATDLRARPAEEGVIELADRISRAKEDRARRKTLEDSALKLDAQASDAHVRVEQQTVELASSEDAVSAEARVELLDASIAELDASIQQTKYNLGGMETGAKQFDQSLAVEHAAEAQRQLAKVRDLAEQYARARLAAAAVARLLERYRRENQGPVLARASELFSVLTLGSFEGLEVGFDAVDEPVLVALRDKKQLEASALSDGTLDQLYLALRVASLERLVESRGPLPLLLDDVLVHFDDQRAAAALSVLGDLAKKTQVILFTHHRRIVDLATRAISDRDGTTAAHVHELSP